MLELPDNIRKAVELALRLGYAKGKADGIRGSQGPETLEEFIKTRLEDIRKLL